MAGRVRRSSGTEYPPLSRLFIICPKSLEEKDFQEHFGKFGKIEEIFVVKDRVDGEKKGVCYIQFSKTSEAARALEAMNGKVLGTGRGIKVMVAASRDQGKKDINDEDTLHRLFVMVPKNFTDDQLYDQFNEFGDIDYAHILKDRNTKENKGFAYVKYFKFSQAADAYEGCDKKFRAVFAEPKKSREERSQQDTNMKPAFSRGQDSNAFSRNDNMIGSFLPPINAQDGGYNKLLVIGSPDLNQDMLWKLFDLVPSMEFCDVHYDTDRNLPPRAIAQVAYSSSRWASYAREKLHGFEYPPGFRLIVRPDFEDQPAMSRQRDPLKRSASGSMDRSASGSMERSGKPDLIQIAETIAHATSLIKAAGLPPDILQSKFGIGGSDRFDEPYCSVRLPDPQPLVHIDTETKARCFIVSIPTALPGSTLKDIFSRFGNLIDVYMLNNRNCGYAKYGCKQSAEDAIKTLHGAEVQGMRLKVIEAEERPDRKRAKMDFDE